MKSLEAQISDMEAETERLSRALEQQRSASAEVEVTTNRKVEEFSRELQKKVNPPFIKLRFSDLTHVADIRCRPTEAEAQTIPGLR